MTAFEPENLGLMPAGLPLLRDLIHERTGLFFDNGRCETLSDRLAPLVIGRGFRSFLDFYYLLKYDDAEALSAWHKVMDALAVQETYFWREIDQIEALAGRVMPELARAARGAPVRIWSAPCASGEEPLTIAMVLNEAGWFDRVAIEIHASDGSAAAIQRARHARYRDRAFRALPPAMRDKYFVAAGDGWAPCPSLAARITSWSIVNLMDRMQTAAFAASPVIFCRNAFIYFSPESVKRVVDGFADAMPSPGYLFTGASESLLRVTDRFALEEIDGAFAYVKRQDRSA
jgi:chemotaxis protein methyltransferase CheR